MIFETDGRTLLERMSQQEDAEELVFDEAQASIMVEFMVPRLIKEMPGMAAFGFSCDVERVDGGWDIQIRRPK